MEQGSNLWTQRYIIINYPLRGEKKKKQLKNSNENLWDLWDIIN